VPNQHCIFLILIIAKGSLLHVVRNLDRDYSRPSAFWLSRRFLICDTETLGWGTRSRKCRAVPF
jgi:hypothetical protein